MKINTIKELFKKLSIDTLYSLELIIQYSDNANQLYTIIELVLKNKEINRVDYFQGINEYDFLTKLHNFDLTSINTHIEIFNNEELAILKKIIESAIMKITPQHIEKKLIPSLNKTLDIICYQLPDELSENDLEIFLAKMTITDLDAFYFIVKYAWDIDKDLLYKLTDKKYNKAGIKRWAYFSIPYNQVDFGLLSMLNNITKFNYQELKYLYLLVDNASFYLTNNIRLNDPDAEAVKIHLIQLRDLIDSEIQYKEANISKLSTKRKIKIPKTN